MARKLRRIADDGSRAERGSDATPAKATPRRRPFILYVEDEDVNWRVTAKTLSERYQMVRAASSREVFEILARTRFDAILMDIQLANSDLDGIEITKLLTGDPSVRPPPYAVELSLPKVPPIIFVTAYTARYSKADLLAVGGVDVIGKPVDLIALHLSLARCIANRIAG